MTEIAQEAGVAPGTLYHYFESKEALFYYVLERGTSDVEESLPDDLLPVPDPGRERLEKLLEKRASRGGRLPALDRALERDAPGDVRAELEEIVGELFDRVARGRRVAAAIEASLLDHPDLARIWFVDTRRALVRRLARFLEQRAATGRLRTTPDAVVAARFVLETCVYFGRHRYGDPHPEDLPDATRVREAVLDLVVHALIEPHP